MKKTDKLNKKNKIEKTDSEYLIYPWKKQKPSKIIEIAGGEGVFFWDTSGKKYYDMSSQLVNMNLGFGNKEIISAIQQQVEKLAYIAPKFATDVAVKLAKTIIEEIMPSNMGKIFFSLSGADANEHAIKIVRNVTGKHKIMSRYRSYHGSTLGASSITGEARRFFLGKDIPDFVKFFDPYPYREKSFKSEEEITSFYLQKLDEQINYEGKDKIAAIFLEAIPGTNGVIIPPKGYIEGVREICTRYGILLVFDEVMTGWCRTGEWFSFMHWNIKPDIVTFAKGITCGYVPLGGVIVSKEISSFFDNNTFGSGLSYGAHPVGCAAGIAAIEAYRKYNILDNVKKMEPVLKNSLELLKEKHKCLGDVRVKGLFGMIELVKDKKSREPIVSYNEDKAKIMPKIVDMLLSEGFSTYSHENMISVSPPLIINKESIIDAIKILDKVLSWVDDNIPS
ncbi:MAG: aminotransferase class III-fold pyridoxal phosphate-dependent enzyme [Spirochaetaceae bacterium]|nr:aminotransferase class III-fold pyridoxal phosphate-dependent enzyme [Spirochaetaceae bacterium]